VLPTPPLTPKGRGRGGGKGEATPLTPKATWRGGGGVRRREKGLFACYLPIIQRNLERGLLLLLLFLLLFWLLFLLLGRGVS